MRKSTVVVFIVLLAGAYSYYWYKKAEDFKAIIEQSIAEQNTQAKQYSKDTTLIRYDHITMSGYPFSMQANIIKPIVDVPLTALMQSISPASAAQNATSAPNIVLEISYNDQISFASNLEANEFSLIIPGDSVVKPMVNKEARKTITNSSSSPVVCHLGIVNPDNAPWNMPQSFADVNSFLAAFRSADCSVSGRVSKYSDSSELLSSADYFDLAATSTPVSEANYKITLAANIKNAKIFPAYDDLLNSYMPLLYQVTNTPENQRSTTKINMSQYGEQNATIDVSYEGPLDKKYILDPAMSVNFNVNALNLKNALYGADNQIHFTTAQLGNERQTAIKINSSLEATEKYEDLLRQGLADMLTAAATNPAAAQNPFTAQLATLGKPADLAAAIVPKLHNIGKISFNADISLSGDKDKNIVDNGNITINALDLTTNQYGLKIKGTGKTKTGNIPAGDMIATCLLCDDMLNNVGDYAINVDSILANTRPGQLHYVTKPLVEGIKQFLHAINDSTNKDSKEIVVHFVSDDKGNITISGKQLLEVIGLFGVNVGQNLQHAAEAAQQQAAPAAAQPVPATHQAPVKKAK